MQAQVQHLMQLPLGALGADALGGGGALPLGADGQPLQLTLPIVGAGGEQQLAWDPSAMSSIPILGPDGEQLTPEQVGAATGGGAARCRRRRCCLSFDALMPCPQTLRSPPSSPPPTHPLPLPLPCATHLADSHALLVSRGHARGHPHGPGPSAGAGRGGGRRRAAGVQKLVGRARGEGARGWDRILRAPLRCMGLLARSLEGLPLRGHGACPAQPRQRSPDPHPATSSCPALPCSLPSSSPVAHPPPRPSHLSPSPKQCNPGAGGAGGGPPLPPAQAGHPGAGLGPGGGVPGGRAQVGAVHAGLGPL